MLRALPSSLAGVDPAAIVRAVDAALHRHGARRQPAPFEVVLRPGFFAAMASVVVESERIARAVVSEIRVAPLLAGVALVIHPRDEIDAPVLVADIMIPPTGSPRCFVDAAGPAIECASFETRFRAPLAAVLDGAHVERRTTVPPWIAPLSGGAGGRLRVGRGGGRELGDVLVRYVETYLDALDRADSAADRSANHARARAVRDAVRANGPAGKHLARAFGKRFADEYLALLWREDVR